MSAQGATKNPDGGYPSASPVEEDEDAWFPMVRIAGQLAVFLAFAGLSLYILIAMWIGDQSDSYVRRSYSQIPSDGFVLNPYYQSTGIVMRPPTRGRPHNYSFEQVVAFPAPPINQTRDGAFIELPIGMQEMQDSVSGVWTPTTGGLAGSDMTTTITSTIPADMVALLHGVSGLVSASQGSGGIPNIPRCVGGRGPLEGARIMASHARMAQCGLTGLQSVVDVSYPSSTSTTPFSTVHIPYMILVVTWISSSFTLFIISPDDDVIESVIFLTVCAWNLFLAVLSIIPQWNTYNHIPMNNIVLGEVALVLTMLLQIAWAQHKDKNKGGQRTGWNVKSSTMVAPAPAQPKWHGTFSQWEDGGIRKRSPFQVAGFLDALGGGAAYTAGRPFTEPFYVRNIEASRQLDYVTVLETIVTSPLFFTTVMASTSASIPTWALQMVFLTILLSHLLFVPSRKLAQWIAKTSKKEITFLLFSSGLMGLSSILLYAAASVVFWDYADEIFTGVYAGGASLQAAVVILYVFKTIYFAGIWVSMVLSAWEVGKASSEQYKTINLGLRFLNLFCKMVAGSIVASLAINRQLPAYRESPWVDMLLSPR